MALSTWFIGSYANLAETDISVTANGVTETVTIDAGSYYIIDPINGLSLCKQLELALEQHSELAAATITVSLCQDRKVRVASSVAFSATFADTAARNALGFSSMGSSSMAHTAQAISSYVWSPQRPHAPDGRLGTQGLYKYDLAVGSSPRGRMVSTTNSFVRVNAFHWNAVKVGRAWTTDESPGCYFHFFHNFLRTFSKFKAYADVTDDENSTTAASFTGGAQLGPYALRPTNANDVEPDMKRELARIEKYFRIALAVVGTPEYS